MHIKSNVLAVTQLYVAGNSETKTRRVMHTTLILKNGRPFLLHEYCEGSPTGMVLIYGRAGELKTLNEDEVEDSNIFNGYVELIEKFKAAASEIVSWDCEKDEANESESNGWVHKPTFWQCTGDEATTCVHGIWPVLTRSAQDGDVIWNQQLELMRTTNGFALATR